MLNISDNWTGFFLNHLVAENNPNYLDKFLLPNEIDWKLHLAPGVYLQADPPVDVKFLWAYKTLKLHVNSESEQKEPLSEPIPIVVIKYDYGEFDGLQPQKQDAILGSYYRASFDSAIELIEYKRIHNNLVKPGAKEKLEVARRITAEAFIKQRAKEIDRAIDYLIATYGEPQSAAMGVRKLDLGQGIQSFFEELTLETSAYISSGSLQINSKIASIIESDVATTKNSWLREQIPVGQDAQGLILKVAGEEIQRIFNDAVTPVTQAEITSAVGEIYQKRE